MNTRTFITIVAIALLAGCAAADDDDFDAEAAPEAGAAAASDEEDDTPATTYTAPDTSGLNYAETFETDPFEAGRWSKSAHGDYARQSVTLAAPYDPSPAFAADRGMTFDIPATKYGVVSKIAPAVSATGDEDLVIQYELRLQVRREKREERKKRGGRGAWAGVHLTVYRSESRSAVVCGVCVWGGVYVLLYTGSDSSKHGCVLVCFCRISHL